VAFVGPAAAQSLTVQNSASFTVEKELAVPGALTESGGGTNGQTQYIPPFQAFFVKANGSSPSIGGIEAADKARGEAPELKRNATESPRITLRLSNGSGSRGETTALRYHEDALAGKDASDAYQLLPLSSTYALVATEMAGSEVLFNHQNRPAPATISARARR